MDGHWHHPSHYLELPAQDAEQNTNTKSSCSAKENRLRWCSTERVRFQRSHVSATTTEWRVFPVHKARQGPFAHLINITDGQMNETKKTENKKEKIVSYARTILTMKRGIHALFHVAFAFLLLPMCAVFL